MTLAARVTGNGTDPAPRLPLTWKFEALFAAALLTAAALYSSSAQCYPLRPVRMVVPYPPGGTVDVVARVLAQALGEQLGHNFVVDNRAGANGTLGSHLVARSSQDGHTLLVQASIFVINPLFLNNVPYNVQKDFTAIVHVGSVPLIVMAHPGVAAATLKEFVALARASPGKYNFATSSLGSAGHLSIEVIKRDMGLAHALTVPYKGSGPALADLMGGQVQVMADPMPSALPLVKAGRLRALAVTSARRAAFLPETPTVAESGIAGFEMVSWYGIWGPAGLAPDIVARLASETAKAVRSSAASERLGAHGFVAAGDGPQAFSRYIDGEIRRYARIVKEANIKAE
jgi:tripartite-type tricarboxylate transporter receptor subunit TctC